MRLVLVILAALLTATSARADPVAGGSSVTLPAAKLEIQLPDGGSWSIEAQGADDLVSLTGTSLVVLVGHLTPGLCAPPPASIGAQKVDPPPYLPAGSEAYQVQDRVLACWNLAGGSFLVVTTVPPDQVAVAQALIGRIIAAASAASPPPPPATRRVTLAGTGLVLDVPAEANIQRGNSGVDLINLGANRAAIGVRFSDPCTLPPEMTRASDAPYWAPNVAVFEARSATELLASACVPTGRGTLLVAIDYAGPDVSPQDAPVLRTQIAAIYAAVPPATTTTTAAAPPAQPSDACSIAVSAPSRVRAVDDRCLKSSPTMLLMLGTGYGGASLGSTWTYYGTADVMIGPLRFEGRGRVGFNSPWFDGLVGYRIGYHYGPGSMEFLSYTGHDANYNYYTTHDRETMIRSETVLVAGMRGMYLDPPDGITSFPKGLDFGKTYEAGIQRYIASGLHTHERLELLAILRDGNFGGETTIESDFGPLIYGVELGYVPYGYGMSSGNDFYFAFNLGVALEL